MLLKDLHLAHRMLKEKTSGFEYVNQWIKLVNPYSWKIFHMRNIDQQEWKRIKKSIDPELSRKEKDILEYIRIDNIQIFNTEKLKEIVYKKGCITISKFGMVASHSAWLIAQHSDHDKEFQKEYLKKMKENKEDVLLENFKSLEKRLVV
jgi:hypothetical protein